MKKITRRSFLAAAGVSAAALALTACGGSSNSAASTSTAASSTAASAAGDATAAANDPKVTLVYAEVNPLDTIVGRGSGEGWRRQRDVFIQSHRLHTCYSQQMDL